MTLQEYFDEHKPKMPKLINGANDYEVDEEEEDDEDDNEDEAFSNSEETGENNIKIAEVQSIAVEVDV